MKNRTDNSSISFGRRVHHLEQENATIKAKLSALEKDKLTNEQKQLLSHQQEYQAQENLKASALLANPGSSVNELASVDVSQLKPAQRYLVQDELSRTEGVTFSPIEFDEAAQDRIRNFQNLKARRNLA